MNNMTKKKTPKVLALMFLFSILLGLFFVGSVQANFMPMLTPTPAVVIADNGAISPASSPITRNGNVYSLTGDLVGYTLAIECDGIVLDGAGYSIRGINNTAGIFLQEGNDITLQNLNISGFTHGILSTWLYYGHYSEKSNTIINCSFSNNTYGIYLNDFSAGNTLTGNTATNNTYGICLSSCSNNLLRSNQMANNTYNFFVYSSSGSGSMNDVDPSNTVDGKPIIYWINQQGKEVPANAGYIALVGCKDLTVQGFNLKGNGQAMLLAEVTNITVTNNFIEGNGNGIWLINSHNNTIAENTFSNNVHNALYISSSNNNTLKQNTFLNNGLEGTQSSQVLGSDGRAAIRLSSSSNNFIIQNTLIGNGEGIDLRSCSSNLMCQNNLTATSGIGIGFFQCSLNNVTQNRITQSTDWAIRLWYSTTQNVVNANYIANNSNGILLDEAEYNRIIQNTITNNTGWGIQLKSASDTYMTASNNTITHNNFVGNQQEDGLDVSIPGIWVWHGGNVAGVGNFWDDGKEGNYWGDYQTRYPHVSEVPGAGIWDVPWEINENNIDHCPLTSPCTAGLPINFTTPLPNQTPSPTATPTPTPDMPQWQKPPVTLLTPENKTYPQSTVKFSFVVAQPVSWIGYSLDGQANATINGNASLVSLNAGAHSLVIYAQSLDGAVGGSSVVNFAVQAPEVAPHVFPWATAVGAVLFAVALSAVGLVWVSKRRGTGGGV